MENDAQRRFGERFATLTQAEAESLTAALGEANVKETIYMVESPSPEDLFHGRNEGDALAKTLSLAEIDVVYYIATTEETFQDALDDIAIRINQTGEDTDMPFVHISAHGHEAGLELTDGGAIYWEQLTKKLHSLSDIVGRLEVPIPGIGGLPKINLSLSSCSAFTNYHNSLISASPVQMMLGPLVDVGWCQSLIGFTTFFYHSFILRKDFFSAVEAMNAAAGKSDLFKIHTELDLNALTGPAFDSLMDALRKDNSIEE